MIHSSADVSDTAIIGAHTKVWHRTQICAAATIGESCTIGSNVFIDREVAIGDRVKVQTGAQLYHGTIIESGAFIGPMVCLTNDKLPRSITPDGRLKTDADWVVGKTLVKYGASLGAGSIVLSSVTIGRFAMVGAGAVVVEDVPDHGLVVGTPARLVGYACACGHRLSRQEVSGTSVWACLVCGATYVGHPGDGLRRKGERTARLVVVG